MRKILAVVVLALMVGACQAPPPETPRSMDLVIVVVTKTNDNAYVTTLKEPGTKRIFMKPGVYGQVGDTVRVQIYKSDWR